MLQRPPRNGAGACFLARFVSPASNIPNAVHGGLKPAL